MWGDAGDAKGGGSSLTPSWVSAYASVIPGSGILRASAPSKRQPEAATERQRRAIRHKSKDLRVDKVFGSADPSLGVILELVHKSRHLRAKLKRWLQSPVIPPLHVLLADPDPRVLDSLTQTLERVAASNARFGLPPFPLLISRASTQAEVQAKVLEAAVAWTAQTWFQRR